MLKADLHVHSRYSNTPTDWTLQKLKAAESYTEPEFIYQTARASGMTHVTVTDHDAITGSLLLQQAHPDCAFTGVESTVSFPGEDCQVHILVYGLTPDDFAEIERTRRDIYQFREVLRERRLPYSVAHALFAVGKTLTLSHLEKLVLLFDVFEGINGSQARAQNDTWMSYLAGLTPEAISDLYRVHRIEPLSPDPWVKGLTGGTDDHAGLFIGETYSHLPGEPSASPEIFLDALRDKRTLAGGLDSTYRDMVLSVFKVSYEVALHSQSHRSLHWARHPLVRQIAESVFANRPVGRAARFQIRLFKQLNTFRPTPSRSLILNLADRLSGATYQESPEKARLLHEILADASDQHLQTFIQKAAAGLREGNLAGITRSIGSPLIGLLLSAPFYTTFRVMNRSRSLARELKQHAGLEQDPASKRILWFSDDPHAAGPAQAGLDGQVVLVCASRPGEPAPAGGFQRLTLPVLSELPLRQADAGGLRIPSLLRSLERVFDYEPDEVYIATPGPVGALGLLFSWLLDVRTVGISQQDFLARLAGGQPGQPTLPGWLAAYQRWFYSLMDEVLPEAGSVQLTALLPAYSRI